MKKRKPLRLTRADDARRAEEGEGEGGEAVSDNKLIAWVDVLRGPIIYYKRHDDAWIRVHEDDIAPLVRFLREHFPEQVAEGMKEPRE